jgi:hypothetical protein
LVTTKQKKTREFNGKHIPMVKIIDGGWLPEDDPIFSGQSLIFSVHRSTSSTKSGEKEKSEAPSPKSSVNEPQKLE